METIVKRFEELTVDELYDILKLRVDVFVVEQNCPYPEIDGKDRFGFHVIMRDEQGIAAYLRALEPGVSFSEAALGRVITAPDRRRCGLGKVSALCVRTWTPPASGSRRRCMRAPSTRRRVSCRLRKNSWKTASPISRCTWSSR